MGQINLDIVTPERRVFQGQVDMIIAPGSEGFLGILPSHTPLITSLRIGIARIKNNDEQIKVAIGGGFMEVQPDKIIILANTAELGNEIDISRARAAKERAEERIATFENGGVASTEFDLLRARTSLQRALTRLKAADDDGTWRPGEKGLEE